MPNWTTKEIEILKEKYPTQGTRIPELSRHTYSSVMTKALRLNLEYIPRPKRAGSENGKWTPEEEKILKHKYPDQGANIPELQHRTGSSIYYKARTLGLEYQAYWERGA